MDYFRAPIYGQIDRLTLTNIDFALEDLHTYLAYIFHVCSQWPRGASAAGWLASLKISSKFRIRWKDTRRNLYHPNHSLFGLEITFNIDTIHSNNCNIH